MTGSPHNLSVSQNASSKIFIGTNDSITVTVDGFTPAEGLTYTLYSDSNDCSGSDTTSNTSSNRTGLTEGVHHFSAQVSDVFGNLSNCATLDYIYDETPPDVVVNAKCGNSNLKTYESGSTTYFNDCLDPTQVNFKIQASDEINLLDFDLNGDETYEHVRQGALSGNPSLVVDNSKSISFDDSVDESTVKVKDRAGNVTTVVIPHYEELNMQFEINLVSPGFAQHYDHQPIFEFVLKSKQEDLPLDFFLSPNSDLAFEYDKSWTYPCDDKDFDSGEALLVSSSDSSSSGASDLVDHFGTTSALNNETGFYEFKFQKQFKLLDDNIGLADTVFSSTSGSSQSQIFQQRSFYLCNSSSPFKDIEGSLIQTEARYLLDETPFSWRELLL